MTPVLEAASKSFGPHKVLDGISLDLAQGSISCLLGHSGCGKSTLLRIAAGLISVDAGRVLINPAQCAMVFQEPRLLPWLTVAENLALSIRSGGKRECMARIRVALDQVQLGDIERFLPRELSGGMAQRVGLARALLRQPKFLLMDEPFAALDAITRGELQKMLGALIAEQKTTCLFVTHDIDEALLIAGHIYVMKEGKIEFDYSLYNVREYDSIKQRVLVYLQKQ